MDGGSGNDIIVGGPGFDTVTFSGPQSAYTLTISTSGISIRDRRAEGNGIDEISGIEMLDFLDNDWPLHLFDGGASLSEREVRELVEVYIAYFNRAPDAIGLAFYADSLTRGSTIEEAARTFLDSDEYSAAYPPELSNADFAREVYLNVLGREPDPNGFEFWVGHLDSGAIGRELFVLDVLRGVKPGTGDEEYLATKTDLGIYLAITKGLSIGGRMVMNAYDGSVESVVAAVEIIDDLYEAGADPFYGDFIIEFVGVADDPFSP
jgi:Ca2+-binding RTX toxin-like protein